MVTSKNKTSKSAKETKSSWNIISKEYILKLILDPHYLINTCVLLFIFEIFLCIFIINKVNYTEIDWKAYMQEVEGFLNGTLDYSLLRGDTGPLVYPAGFVYIYSALYYITSSGQNIIVAQYIFMFIYLFQTFLNYRILIKTSKVPPYALVISTLTSYRIHSIYMLRLFNDPIAVLLFYISLNLFISNKWKLGSLFYSLAVSVKMNILLYAPCLLITYLTNLTLPETFINLFICGIVQLILGIPFLLHNFKSYIKGSFDFGRTFDHKWTVNYRFLPQDLFENRLFHISLLLIHIVILLIFSPLIKRYLVSYAKLNCFNISIRQQIYEEKKQKSLKDKSLTKKEKEFLKTYEEELKKRSGKDETCELEGKLSKTTQLLVLPFYITNIIGITFSRSLHYQFYCWYFYSILYLVFCTPMKNSFRFLILGLIEYCWNVYPSTNFSSILLHICHVSIVYGVYKFMKN